MVIRRRSTLRKPFDEAAKDDDEKDQDGDLESDSYEASEAEETSELSSMQVRSIADLTNAERDVVSNAAKILKLDTKQLIDSATYTRQILRNSHTEENADEKSRNGSDGSDLDSADSFEHIPPQETLHKIFGYDRSSEQQNNEGRPPGASSHQDHPAGHIFGELPYPLTQTERETETHVNPTNSGEFYAEVNLDPTSQGGQFNTGTYSGPAGARHLSEWWEYPQHRPLQHIDSFVIPETNNSLFHTGQSSGDTTFRPPLDSVAPYFGPWHESGEAENVGSVADFSFPSEPNVTRGNELYDTLEVQLPGGISMRESGTSPAPPSTVQSGTNPYPSHTASGQNASVILRPLTAKSTGVKKATKVNDMEKIRKSRRKIQEGAFSGRRQGPLTPAQREAAHAARQRGNCIRCKKQKSPIPDQQFNRQGIPDNIRDRDLVPISKNIKMGASKGLFLDGQRSICLSQNHGPQMTFQVARFKSKGEKLSYNWRNKQGRIVEWSFPPYSIVDFGVARDEIFRVITEDPAKHLNIMLKDSNEFVSGIFQLALKTAIELGDTDEVSKPQNLPNSG
ncbi:MAG: hypothetical protein Q9227_008017 [Pyrenula ochraceoflavens]